MPRGLKIFLQTIGVLVAVMQTAQSLSEWAGFFHTLAKAIFHA
jgi:hypothetical protein